MPVSKCAPERHDENNNDNDDNDDPKLGDKASEMARKTSGGALDAPPDALEEGRVGLRLLQYGRLYTYIYVCVHMCVCV
jgi:hypothetical protein